MEKQEKNNIDNLFKAGFEKAGSSPQYREQDWDDMNNLLNRDEKRVAFLRMLPVIISAVAAMLLLAVGLFFLNDATAIDKTSLKQAKTIHQTPRDTGTYGRPAQQPAALNHNNPLSVSERTNYTVNKKNREGKSFFILSAAATGRNIAGPKLEKDKDTAHRSTNEAFIYGKVSNNKKTLSDTAIEKQTYASMLSGIDTTTKALALTNQDTTTILIAAAKTKQTTKAEAFKQSPRFTLSLIVSPDINSTGGFSQNKVGTNAGLLLTVGLSKKWSISTGAIYADKPYMTAFSNYATTYKFTNNPSSVTASCIVLDIPINVGYMFYKRGGNRFSFGTGLSSYFMLRENYNYGYSGTVQNSPLTYNIANKNKHLLGVLNINATYQRAVSSKFDIGIQPYFKLPLTGIGYGQVNLKSAGVAVGLMWNINTRTKP